LANLQPMLTNAPVIAGRCTAPHRASAHMVPSFQFNPSYSVVVGAVGV